MSMNVCNYDDSSNWGPRAKEFLKTVERQQQQGPLVSAQDHAPQEVHRIMQCARPETPPQSATPPAAGMQSMAEPQDEVHFSFA